MFLRITNFAGPFALLLGGGEGDGTDLMVAEVQPLATIRTVIARRVRAIAYIDMLGVGGRQEKERQYDPEAAHFRSGLQPVFKQRSSSLAGS
jgi:hypothetical protein